MTDTELKIIRLTARGSTVAEIARELQRPDHVVALHLTLLMKDFGVDSRRELVMEARKRALLE